MPANLSGREKALSTVKDGLMAAAVTVGAVNGIQGARVARRVPGGAVLTARRLACAARPEAEHRLQTQRRR